MWLCKVHRPQMRTRSCPLGSRIPIHPAAWSIRTRTTRTSSTGKSRRTVARTVSSRIPGIDPTYLAHQLRRLTPGADSEIDNTTQAAKSTPLCTVVVDDKVYLYFINSSKSLIRLERTGSNVWTNQISDSQNEWNANPISALCSQNKKYIVLRQQYTEGDGWLEYPDKRGM